MRRAPVASLGDMFCGRGLTGKKLAGAEGGYPSEDFWREQTPLIWLL